MIYTSEEILDTTTLRSDISDKNWKSVNDISVHLFAQNHFKHWYMRTKITFKYTARETKDFHDNGCYLGNYIRDFFSL